MGYLLTKEGVNAVLKEWAESYLIYAPVRMSGKGAFSETDSIRYAPITTVEEIEFEKKSDFPFKEVLIPLSETLFFFTEDQVTEADGPKKNAIILLRSCDLHSVKRLDEIYIKNEYEDYYYKRIRDNVKFVLMGCKNAFENCFCVDMQTNRIETYHKKRAENTLPLRSVCYVYQAA